MAYFKTENPILGNFWRALEWKRLAYFLSFGIHILRPFGNLEAVWHIFPRFGILCHEKSGIPAQKYFSHVLRQSASRKTDSQNDFF
jgi:hypothetical protein